MKLHTRQLQSWKYWDIHPDDFEAAINARLKFRVADSLRPARNPTTRQAVEEDLFVAWLAGEGINFWSEAICADVMMYAIEHGAGRFFIKLGKAINGERELFDDLDVFILENRRKDHCLWNKTRAEAVTILRDAGFGNRLSPHDELAKDAYAKRLKRNGLLDSQELGQDARF